MNSSEAPPTARPRLSFVIPCYNEQEVLGELHRRVKAAGGSLDATYEIILVNDGSSDGTLDVMVSLAATDPTLVVVDLSRNHGHQLALSAGLQVSRGERVLVLDADLQDPPELVGEMMALMDGGSDVVYAQRRTRRGDAPMKRLACAAFYRVLTWLADRPIPLDTGDFRLLSRRVVDEIVRMPECHRFIRGMVSWVGYKQVPFAYDRKGRFAGETKYPLIRLVTLALDGIVTSSTRPLMLATYAGGLFALLCVGLIVYALYSWLFVGETPQGWTSLMIIVTLLGSVQLLVLGIVGQYVGRVHEQVRGRPIFIIRDIIRGTPNA